MKNKVVWIAIAVVALGVLFLALKPNSYSSKTNSSQATNNSTSKTFVFEINDGKVVKGEDTLSVNQDDEVTIKVTSNKADELHLHGYDKEVELEAGAPAQITFNADKSGRFEIELHKADKVISALEVQPKP